MGVVRTEADRPRRAGLLSAECACYNAARSQRMFGIGFSELVIIAVVLIVAVGPKRMPGMLKAVVRAYQEFRRATRELRASTGIDEILQDEDLRSLRKPIHVPAPSSVLRDKPARRSLSAAERERESPQEGVDVAEVRYAEERPSAEEAERVRQAKIASSDAEERVRAAKVAGAPREDELEGIRDAKVAASAAARAGGDE